MTYWKVSFSRCHVGPACGVLQLLRSTIHPLMWWRLDLEPFSGMGGISYQYYNCYNSISTIYLYILHVSICALEHAALCQGGQKSASGSWRCGERCAVCRQRCKTKVEKIKKRGISSSLSLWSSLRISSLRISQKRTHSKSTHPAVFLLFLIRKTLPLQVFLVWTAGWTWGKFFLCRYSSMNHGTLWMKACLWDWLFSSCWGHKASHCRVF